MNNETVRSFIAVELPAELVARLRGFQTGLNSSRLRFVKWVDPGSIHLTLKFLGNVDAGRLEAVKSALETATMPHRTFRLATGQTGFFPGLQRARVFWLGLEGDTAELSGLQQDIDRAMAGLGFERESRPFTAHLTLARLREECTREQRQEFTGLAQHAAFESGPDIQVQSVALMRSRLTPQGALYSRLAEYELKGE
ncbi:MAG: RNA 2',3'-cyclic phosphodiesterase [Dehalococcoidia bacterium]